MRFVDIYKLKISFEKYKFKNAWNQSADNTRLGETHAIKSISIHFLAISIIALCTSCRKEGYANFDFREHFVGSYQTHIDEVEFGNSGWDDTIQKYDVILKVDRIGVIELSLDYGKRDTVKCSQYVDHNISFSYPIKKSSWSPFVFPLISIDGSIHDDAFDCLKIYDYSSKGHIEMTKIYFHGIKL